MTISREPNFALSRPYAAAPPVHAGAKLATKIVVSQNLPVAAPPRIPKRAY